MEKLESFKTAKIKKNRTFHVKISPTSRAVQNESSLLLIHGIRTVESRGKIPIIR